MDEIDIQILNLLQKDARMNIKTIAQKVCLSSPAVSNRIEKLEREKYISGYQAIVNPMALGLYTKAFICLGVEPEEKKTFYPFIKKCLNVVECNCVTGDYSMLLEVLFKTTMELDVFIGELQKFGRTRTLIVFSTSVEHRGVEVVEM
ncbi:MAG: Lrp/AsnC family transcriptional regulator [Hespellia sp.]|nr:Lrp/AsnC family transcriptional regulator [Hespellia sp.]